MGYGIDELDYWFDEDEESIEYGVDPVWEMQAQARYTNNKTVNVGSKISCACCGKMVVKKSYQSQFCSNSGRNNCKDNFWNRVDRKRFERALIVNKLK